MPELPEHLPRVPARAARATLLGESAPSSCRARARSNTCGSACCRRHALRAGRRRASCRGRSRRRGRATRSCRRRTSAGRSARWGAGRGTAGRAAARFRLRRGHASAMRAGATRRWRQAGNKPRATTLPLGRAPLGQVPSLLAAQEPEKQKNRFKVAGTLVMAMRRFQGANSPLCIEFIGEPTLAAEQTGARLPAAALPCHCLAPCSSAPQPRPAPPRSARLTRTEHAAAYPAWPSGSALPVPDPCPATALTCACASSRTLRAAARRSLHQSHLHVRQADHLL